MTPTKLLFGQTSVVFAIVLAGVWFAMVNLRAVQILLGHSKIENTVRYLGIDVEDALAFAENTEI